MINKTTKTAGSRPTRKLKFTADQMSSIELKQLLNKC